MIIRINNLFGKYNNELNLNNKCNIFIGENGIGKSTSIKIFNALFKLDFIDLKNYYFESIEIIDNDEVINIDYNDMTLNKEYLIKQYVGEEYDKYKNIKNDFEKLKKDDLSVHPSQLHSKDVETQKLIELLNFNYDFENFLNCIDIRLLYKILKFNKKLLKNEKIIMAFEDNGASSYYLKFLENQYKNASIIEDEGRYYVESEVSKKFITIKNKLKELQYKNVLLINMASDFEVINDLDRKYAYNDIEKDSMDDKAKRIMEYNEHCSSSLEYRYDLRRKREIYSKLSDKDFIELLKANYKIKNGEGLKNNKIDFGYFLFNHIYSKDKQTEFKNDFYDFIFNNIQNIEDNKNYRVSDISFNKIKYYLAPLVDANNIMGEKLSVEWKLSFSYDQGDDFQLLMKFCQEYKHKYINIKDERLLKLNNLFQKYFKNKEIVATPFGISISTKDLNNDIYFEELSSGERKLIILFTIAVFSDDLIILLDEPESSLSVVWQEQLIPDIFDNTNFKKLIIATQSPYVIESEILDDYIIPLIDGDINE